MTYHLFTSTCPETGTYVGWSREPSMKVVKSRMAREAASGRGKSNFMRSIRTHGIDAYTFVRCEGNSGLSPYASAPAFPT